MKNYKKIYNRMIKEITDLQNTELNSDRGLSGFSINYYAYALFKILNKMKDEVFGKKWHNQIMTEKEFKQWKKNLNIVEK